MQNKLDLLLTKRHKIVITSLVVTIGFLFITHTVNIVFRRYYLIAILGALAYVLSLWSLWKGMTKTKALILLILPVFYCLTVPSFYFLFREIRWLTRLPVAVFFGFSFYCLLLAQNVFHVASDRTIPLYRAATAVNFVFTIFVAILLNSVLFSLTLPFYWNAILIFVFNFPLVIQSLWSIKIDKLSSHILVYAGIASLLLAEGALALSFWHTSPFIRSLLLSTIYYVVLGLLHDYLNERVTKRGVFEYASVGVGVFLLVFIFTSSYIQ